jgi:ParB-like chromosome segregation protein Spo0J
MLALAHRLQAAIDHGDFRDRADLARQLGFTRARISQLLDLLMLAPDLQEQILNLEAVDGVEPLSERALRAVVKIEGWEGQRRAWVRLA